MARTARKIDPVRLISHALTQVKTKNDYSRIVSANTPENFDEAWQSLSADEQQRISTICNATPQPDLSAIALEIIACGTYLQLQAIKSEYGETLVKKAWLTIPIPQRQLIKELCENEQKAENPQPVNEPVINQVKPQHEPATKPRTLFSISDDLLKLNEVLDDCDDTQQHDLINNWLEQLGAERDNKLDGYAALITEMLARAEVRKAEAKRLAELAAADENRARLLKDRLKLFFELHGLKTLNTARYRLSLAKNGGRQPLVLDDSVPVTQLPEQFQRVTIDPDTVAIREVLERGERLEFAHLGERGTSLRIK